MKQDSGKTRYAPTFGQDLLVSFLESGFDQKYQKFPQGGRSRLWEVESRFLLKPSMQYIS